MKIGLISDTHGYLDPRVLEYFKDCDEIWHAGDIGPGVAEELERNKPLRAVYGNIDDSKTRLRFPEDWRTEIEGLRVWMTHIGGAPPRYNPRVLKVLQSTPVDLFICGHSHIVRAVRDKVLGGMLFLNPGAAGRQGFHQIRTIMRMEISNGKVTNLEVVELGGK